jgi:hypothetical protein
LRGFASALKGSHLKLRHQAYLFKNKKGPVSSTGPKSLPQVKN